MLDGIDPTRPARDEPVSKAWLRGTLAAIKAALGHGGVFRRDAAGAVERRTADALSELSVSIADFGAKLDGSADDTDALRWALDYVIPRMAEGGGRRSAIHIRGSLRFNPALLGDQWQAYREADNSNLQLLVHGELKPTTTLVLWSGVSLIGSGGFTGTQFQIGPTCLVRGFSGGAPAVEVAGNHVAIEAITVEGSDGPGVQIGSRLAELGSVALIRLRNVGVLAPGVPTAEGLRLENVLWIWLERFAFNCLTGSGPAIHLADSFFGTHHTGIVRIRAGVISGGGILYDPQRAGPTPPGNFSVADVIYENVEQDFLTLDTSFCEFADLTLERVSFADSRINRPTFINVVGTTRRRVTGVTLAHMGIPWDNPRFIKGHPIDDLQIIGYTGPVHTAAAEASPRFQTYPQNMIYANGGELEHVDAFRNAEMLPNMLATAGIANLAVPQDADDSGWDLSALDVESGHPAPDGSATAYLIEYPVGQSGWMSAHLLSTYRTVKNGDFFIIGGWFRSAVPGQGIMAFDQGQPCALELVSGTLEYSPSFNWIRAKSAWANHAEGGWQVCVGWDRFTGADGEYDVRYLVFVDDGFAYTMWKPWALHLDGELFTVREVRRLAARLTNVPLGAAPGVLRMFRHQCSATGRGLTSARPDPAAVGAGAQWYDTTLGKPIWSDGQVWRDAAGNTV